MTSSTIEKVGIKIKETDVNAFSNSDKVSEYAKDGTNFMKLIGLIEGYNNEFRPLDNLTRAKSAHVISKLLKLIKGN